MSNPRKRLPPRHGNQRQFTCVCGCVYWARNSLYRHQVVCSEYQRAARAHPEWKVEDLSPLVVDGWDSDEEATELDESDEEREREREREEREREIERARELKLDLDPDGGEWSDQDDGIWCRDYDLEPLEVKAMADPNDAIDPVDAWGSGDDGLDGDSGSDEERKSEEPLLVAPDNPWFPFPNEETSKFALLMTISDVSNRNWQRILDTLHSGPFVVGNLPRSARTFRRYLLNLPNPKVTTVKLEQVVHQKKKRSVSKELSDFKRPYVHIPIRSLIQVKYLSLLSVIEQYCASPGLQDLFAFEWTNNESFQEYTDAPLHKEFYKYRHLMSMTHDSKEYSVGDFVQINTDNHHMYRIDSFFYEPGSEEKGNPAPPVLAQALMRCTAFLVVKFWRQYFSTPRPYGVEDMDLVQIEDEFIREIKLDLISRKWTVHHDRERPPDQRRRPPLTAYCGHSYNVETNTLGIYAPAVPVFTPPEVKNGTLFVSETW
jgi:hypothetical protein